MLADLFFIYGFSFILGNFLAHFFKFWFLINFLISLLFYLKFKKLKYSLLVLLFLFAGSLFYFSRLETNLKPPQIKFISDYRNFLEERIKNYLPFPQENVFRGILFGSKFEDYEIKENFVNSGLIHLTAVSGQNLTIMFLVFNHFLKLLPFLTLNLVFYISVFLILFFIFLMGFEGSVLRAGIMGFLLILIRNKFGRIPLRRNVLLLTALIFTLIDPLLLIKDIGSQLSFLAMAGILYLGPILEKKFEFLKFNVLKKTVSDTISAQILTLPLILYYFGNFNLFSVLANVLVLPLIPYFMTLASIFLFLPIKFITWASLPFLNYLLFIAKIFSSFVVYFKIPLLLVIAIYSFIFLEIYHSLKNEAIDFRLNLS